MLNTKERALHEASRGAYVEKPDGGHEFQFDRISIEPRGHKVEAWFWWRGAKVVSLRAAWNRSETIVIDGFAGRMDAKLI